MEQVHYQSFSTNTLMLLPRQVRAGSAANGSAELQSRNFLFIGNHPAKFVMEISFGQEGKYQWRFEISISDIFPAAWTEIAIMPLSFRQLYIAANHTIYCLSCRLQKTNLQKKPMSKVYAIHGHILYCPICTPGILLRSTKPSTAVKYCRLGSTLSFHRHLFKQQITAYR